MPIGHTVTGQPFEYSGTLDSGITVSLKPPNKLVVKPEIVRAIRAEITNRSPVQMGACRKPLVANSVGETLSERYRVSPQVMSYVLPLLVEEGFCTVSKSKPFMIYRKN